MSQSELPIVATTIIHCYLVSGRIKTVEGMFVQVSILIHSTIAAESVVTTECDINVECFVEVRR